MVRRDVAFFGDEFRRAKRDHGAGRDVQPQPTEAARPRVHQGQRCFVFIADRSAGEPCPPKRDRAPPLLKSRGGRARRYRRHRGSMIS